MSTKTTAARRQATAAEIRQYWGHGQGTRRVRICRDGVVAYRGSADSLDCQHDYWHLAGYVEDHEYNEYMGEVHIR